MNKYTWIVLVLSLNAFGSESRGFMVRDPITKEVKKVENSAMSRSSCKPPLCEIDYIMRHTFSSKPKPIIVEPSPSPVPIEIPKPVFTPKSIPTGEKYDYSFESVNIFQAWKYTQGSKDIVIGILDSGGDLNNLDTKANILPGYDFVLNKPGVVDGSWHGQHVLGRAGGAGLNGFGVFGVAPIVKILPIRFLDNNGSGATSDAIRGVQYAIEQKVDVLNCSFGSTGKSLFLQEKIQEAIKGGMIVVAAAGNSNSNNDVVKFFPASYPEVISVASSTPNKNLSSFSNYGTSVTTAAPGSNILSTYRNNTVAYLSGTSQASPLVAGVLALAKSIDKNLSQAKAKELLCKTSQAYLTSKTKCGLLDAGKFLSAVDSSK